MLNSMKRWVLTVLLLLVATSALAFSDVTPEEAYTQATSLDNVYILDVRTGAEWQWVGHPGPNGDDEGAALAGKVVNIAYKIDRQGELVVNPVFVLAVKKAFADQPNPVLITMCRSGKRSKAAARELEAAGFKVLNMATGFEGGKDERGYRSVNGWKNAGLPYTYAGAGYSYWQPFF